MLSATLLRQWNETGAIVVQGGLLISHALLQAAAQELAASPPQRIGFPSRDAPATNDIALSASLVAAVQQLLGTTDVRLFESLVFPPGVAESGVAAGRGCRAAALLDPPSGRAEAVHVNVSLADGTVSFCRGDLERPPLDSSSAVQLCGYRRADAEWIAGEGSGWGVTVSGMPRNWIPSLTVDQRNLLSFPPPGSEYWTDDTTHAVSHHYASAASGWGGPEGHTPTPMDMSDYVAAKSTPAEMQVSTKVMTPPPSLDLEQPNERTLKPLPDRWHFKKSTRWATPEATLPIVPSEPDAPVLTEEQVARWHADGFVVVQGIWPESLIDAAVAAAATLPDDQGPGGFPFSEDMQPFNDVCLHPRFLRAAAQCLGTEDVRLVQSGSGKKKYEPLAEGTTGEQMDFIPGEQGLHQDVRAFCVQRNHYLCVDLCVPAALQSRPRTGGLKPVSLLALRVATNAWCSVLQQYPSGAAPPSPAAGDDELHHVLHVLCRFRRRNHRRIQAREWPSSHAAHLLCRRRLASAPQQAPRSVCKRAGGRISPRYRLLVLDGASLPSLHRLRRLLPTGWFPAVHAPGGCSRWLTGDAVVPIGHAASRNAGQGQRDSSHCPPPGRAPRKR